MMQLDEIENWLELAQKEDWSGFRIAKRCNVSMRTLQRYFQKEMGRSLKTWLSEQRLQRAEELLKCGHSVKETAAFLGYKYVSTFSREFSRRKRLSPKQTSGGRATTVSANGKCIADGVQDPLA